MRSRVHALVQILLFVLFAFQTLFFPLVHFRIHFVGDFGLFGLRFFVSTHGSLLEISTQYVCHLM